MKFLKIFIFFSLILGFSFSSCVKDPIDETEIIEQDPVDTELTTTNNLLLNIRDSGDDGMHLDCITILYTFEFEMEDGATVSIASEEDFWDLFSDSLNTIIDFVYPLDVLNADDEETQVLDAIELGELFAACVPDTGWVEGDELVPAFLLDENCFELVFPVELMNLDEEDLVAENIEEFIDLISTNELLFFSWPLELMDSDGTIHNVMGASQFFELMYSCDDYSNPCDSSWYHDDSLFYGLEFIGCYEIQFPVSVIDEEGNVIALEDVDAMMALIFEGTFIVDFEYPFSVLDLDGNSIQVLDAIHLEELLEDCWGGPNGGDGDYGFLFYIMSSAAGGDSACYQIIYPINVQSADSTISQINSDQEFTDYVQTQAVFFLEFPVSVTLTEDASIFEIQGVEDIFEMMENCSVGGGGGPGWNDWGDQLLFIFSTAALGDEACYSIEYPINVELLDSTSTSIYSDDEFVELNNNQEWYWLQFPVSVTLLDDGTAVELGDFEALYELIEDCQ